MPVVNLRSKIQVWNLTLDGIPAIVEGVLQSGITPSYFPGPDESNAYWFTGVGIDGIWLNRAWTGATNYPVIIEYVFSGGGPILYSVDDGPYTTPFHELPQGISFSTFLTLVAATEPSLTNLPVSASGALLSYSTGGIATPVAEWLTWEGFTLFYPPQSPPYDSANPWFVNSAPNGLMFRATGIVEALGVSPGLLAKNEFGDFLDLGGIISYTIPPDPLDPVFNVETSDEPTREISWELPPEAEGTTIQYEFDGEDFSIYQDGADLNYILPGFGSLTVILISTIPVPFQTGEPVEYEFVPATIVIPTGDVSLVIDIALDTSMQFFGDPSGIYTLVPGQFHDDLYEHTTSPASSIEVAIPRPFGTTSYIPEGND